MTTDATGPTPSGGPLGPTPAAPANQKRRWGWKAWGWKGRGILVGLLAAPLLAIGLYTFAAYNWAYSSGERAGYVQKFSRKGWLCKTWEGELAMVSLPGAMPQVFAFTVRDDAVAQHINQTMGQRVSIAYNQHLGLPTTCFGETEYFVYSVRPIPQ